MYGSARKLSGLGVLVGLLSACGDGGGISQAIPTLRITSPSNNSTVNLPASKKVAVGYDTNYVIRAPQMCGGQKACGHIYVLVDNSACNTPSLPYNTLALASPTEADLSKCQVATGMHTITLELRQDDGSIVTNLVGGVVKDDVTITTQ